MRFIKNKHSNGFFYLVAVGIFFSFIGFAVSGENGLIQLIKLRRAQSGLEADNRKLLYQNLELRQQQKSLYQLQTLEYRARKSLGLVYKDEVVYVIPSEIQ